MEFRDLRDDALSGLPRISRKRRKGMVAIVNTNYRSYMESLPFRDRPDLFARWMRVHRARMERLTRRYSPNDPNRIPR